MDGFGDFNELGEHKGFVYFGSENKSFGEVTRLLVWQVLVLLTNSAVANKSFSVKVHA